MTHEEAFDRLRDALKLVHLVTAEARIVMDPRDLRGRWALRDAANAIDRAQSAVARNMSAVRS